MSSIDRRHFVAGCFGSVAGCALPSFFVPAAAEAPPGPVAFADGGSAPRLGLGSWHMASAGAAPEAQAEQAMRLGVSLGLNLLDTAELYTEGRAEQMVAKVIAGQRDKIFLVSKIMPEHATADGFEASLTASLKRLGTDHLDLYLLHWRKHRRERWLDTVLFREGDLKVAVAGFESARKKGLIKRWGVSNFLVSDMEELLAVPGGENCSVNQVLYNLKARESEKELKPWCAKHKMPIMAYSPLGNGGKASLLSEPTLKSLAQARNVSPATVALAWAMRDGRTIVVTETASDKHVRDDAAALSLTLSEADIKALDAAFPLS